MTSVALKTWQGKRSTGLNHLLAAHAAARTGRAGRQWLTTEINHALIVRLMSELQGFARDLYDEATTVLVNPSTVPSAWARPIVGAQFRMGRKLDQGNAGAGNLGSDFGRLGIQFWDEIDSVYGTPQKKVWTGSLDRLNRARNAIAHNNSDQLIDSITEQPLDLRSAKAWRRDLDDLATAMDNVLGSYLATLSGTHPWP